MGGMIGAVFEVKKEIPIRLLKVIRPIRKEVTRWQTWTNSRVSFLMHLNS